MVSCFKLPFTFDAQRLAAELALFAPDDWVPHFNTFYYEGEWSGIALRAVGGVARQLYPDPSATADFADTANLDRCPYTRAVLATLQCPLLSVRFLKLKAGSSIREHKDYNLGYADGEVRLHVPIVTSPEVRFFLDGQLLAMQPGECWYMDLNLRHRVENHSTIDRVHLVIDCVVNDWMRELFEPQLSVS